MEMDLVEDDITSKLPPVIWRKIFSNYIKNKKDLYSAKLANKNLNFFANEIIVKNYIERIKEERETEDKYITKRINDHCEEKQGLMLSENVFDKLFSISEKAKELEKQLNGIVHKISQQQEMRSTIINNGALDGSTKLKMLSLCNPHSEYMNLNAIHKEIKNMGKEVVELFNGNNNNKRDVYDHNDPLRVYDPLRVQRPRPNNPYDPYSPFPNPGFNDPFLGEPTPDHEMPPGYNEDFERDRNPFNPFGGGGRGRGGGRGGGFNPFNPFDPNKNFGPRYL
eukprot:TRINITY_DN12213_c0_g1_i1.p1 TRINITY_DN12213_c0_g1~~TRINITY_DN12213_c0_g1_i1.p1  ORF type:complete len:280 (+),score=67.93 TRINITY_DN12213_c0_g1_i1:242-1081(+)